MSSARRGTRVRHADNGVAHAGPFRQLVNRISKQDVDAKLDEWELLGARVRKKARRLQRQGPTWGVTLLSRITVKSTFFLEA